MNDTPPRPLRVGLTGGIASGKSAVATMLADLGALVIDSDMLAREVVEPGTEGLELVRQRFGDAVIAPDGSLDRAGLGALVFADAAARRDLEAIIHPRVRARAAEVEAAASAPVVVHVIPLLVEAGQQGSFDEVVVVDVPVAVQRQRLMARNHLNADEAQARISAQVDRATRLQNASHIVDNSGPLAVTLDQVRRLWGHLATRHESLALTEEEE